MKSTKETRCSLTATQRDYKTNFSAFLRIAINLKSFGDTMQFQSHSNVTLRSLVKVSECAISQGDTVQFKVVFGSTLFKTQDPSDIKLHYISRVTTSM